MHRRLLAVFCTVAFAFPGAGASATTQVDPQRLGDLHWRSIGPYRGGRSIGAAGVAGDGRTFYFGAVGGGVWKTQNAGRTWLPIMDAQPVSSIGAIAVAPSDPNTVYVGSGEADMRSDIIAGNGMYRSTDAGATWTHAGLEDTRQIGRILVDPKDARTLLVAALGHAYGPNDERGVYRSTDGGATWTRTLFRDSDTGAIDLAATPSGDTVYASLWQTRRPPWNTYPPSYGPGSGLYVSHDRGVTWKPVAGAGFPNERLGKIGLAVAPSRPDRVYAIVDAKAGGLYRSDDAGATWVRANADRRLWDRGWYFCHVAVDPKDADLVYVSDTGVYRSTDAGAHVEAIKGSPDGDDFHQLWIDPTDGAKMALASDQGTTVSVDRARTWSSWFNQPTAQFYHVSTDDGFPYRLYGAQQDSGAAAIVSRSDHRGIEARDWRPIVAGDENGYIAPDPANPNVVFGGKVTREDLRTSQTRSISPTAGRPGPWRDEWTLPLVFGPDRTLYYANQRVFRTRDGGDSWSSASGDLTRAHDGVPATLDAATAADAATGEPRGVVYALAPSFRDPKVVWAGTDDGLVRLTRDGAKTWLDVTPPGITPWSHVSGIEASHFDARTAYVAIDRHRLDDERPYLYVTHDAGRSWRAATAGIPDGSFVNGVREDPVRPGLLYAATETGVFVSFDDGASWQSLQENMPVVSVRDIAVHGSDLAIATHGRAFWILDDVEPLRELAADPGTRTRLFAPRVAIRTRDGNDEAEASPPETPLGENPPNGAFLDYVVPAGSGRVTLDVLDGTTGFPVRRYASDDVATPTDPKDVPYPAYWIVTPKAPSNAPGMHRFVWDFHIGAADGPLAAPGSYVVRLGVGGHTYSQRLVLRRDPRIAATDDDLVAQTKLALEVTALRKQVGLALVAAKQLRDAKPALAGRIDTIAGVPADASAVPGARNASDTTSLHDDADLLDELEASIESADARPTANERAAWIDLAARTERALHALELVADERPRSDSATGRSAAVASDQRLATETGLRVLADGGNAVDAAVAIGYTLAVTLPEAGNLGGGGFMLVRLANGRTSFLDFRETAPGAATRDMYLDAHGRGVPDASTVGPRSAGIPGTVAGLELARERFGTADRATLMRDAIDYAEHGFRLAPADADSLARGKALLGKFASTASIFAPDGATPAAGTLFRQPALARTLRRVEADGATAFYRGDVAREIVASVRAAGGIFTRADLASYRALERKPVSCAHRGHTILTAPPPSSGGVVLCEVLGILGDAAPQTPPRAFANVHREVEAERRAFADRGALGDPAFVPVPVSRLLAPAYLAGLRASIAPERATPSRDVRGFGVATNEGHNTTNYSVIDAAGDAVDVTYTLNNTFGSGFVAGETGVLLNDEMDDFTTEAGAPNMFGLVQGTANAIAPGKRPLSSMTPSIVVDAAGRAVLVAGAAGGPRIITTTLDTIRGVLDFGETASEAVAASRMHMQWLPDTLDAEPDTFDAATLARLRRAGYAVDLGRAGSAANAVARRADGSREAAHDPRVHTGSALAY